MTNILKYFLVSILIFLVVTNVRADPLEAAGIGLFFLFAAVFLFILPIVIALFFIIFRFVTNKPGLSIGVYLALGLAAASSGYAFLEGLYPFPFFAIIGIILIYGTIDISVMRRSNRD